MKLLVVNHLLDLAAGGGTAERSFQMSRYLARAGVECTIVTTDIGLSTSRLAELDAVEVCAYPCLLRRFFVPRISWQRLKAHVERADVVHLMGHWTLLNALAYVAARRLGKPYVICPAGALRVYGRSRMLKRVYNALIGRRILHDAAACIAVTAAERTDFEGYGVRPENIAVIPNGIAEDSVPPNAVAAFRNKHGLAAPYILFMGRLNPIKGPDLLLEAFERIKDRIAAHHLVFAGPDEGLRAGLEQKAASAGIGERVHFIGFVDAAEKYQAYRGADVLAIPSRREAMSIVVLEAGVAGTPVLLTDRCGFEDIPGGEIVPATIEGIAAGLDHLLADRSRLPEIGKALREHVLARYGWDSIVRLYMETFQRVTGAGGSGRDRARPLDRVET